MYVYTKWRESSFLKVRDSKKRKNIVYIANDKSILIVIQERRNKGPSSNSNSITKNGHLDLPYDKLGPF